MARSLPSFRLHRRCNEPAGRGSMTPGSGGVHQLGQLGKRAPGRRMPATEPCARRAQVGTLGAMPDRSARLPPMARLLGAAPGVQPFVPLTSISTPEAARAALTAEANTSVMDPVGMRRLWVRELDFLVVAPLVIVGAIGGVQAATNGHTPGWWLFLMLLTFLVYLSAGLLPEALSRSLPAPELIPPFGPARLRWYRQLRNQPAVVPAPAQWPAGAEAYALLSAAATVQSVAPSWLCERVGLRADVGAAWVASLRWQGWLAGGGRRLGLASLPELHLQVTPAGLVGLDAERARLTALAAS